MEIQYVQTPSPQTVRPEPAPAPAAQPAAPTPEELQKRAKETYEAHWGQQAPAEMQPAPAPVPAAAAPVAVPAVEVPPAQRPLSAEDVRSAVREEISQLQPPVQPATQATAQPTLELAEEDAMDLRVCRWLAKEDPAKYGTLPDLWLNYVKKHYAYQDAWTAANPGKEYEIDADEHADFYSQNVPDIDRKVLDNARIEMLAEERAERIMRPAREKLEAEEAWKNAQPDVLRNVNRRIWDFVNKVNPDLAKLLLNVVGEIDMSKENTDRVEDADPVANKLMLKAVTQQLIPFMRELERMAIPQLKVKLAPNSNNLHRAIEAFRENCETAIMADPAKQTRNGKKFIGAAEKETLQQEIANGPGSREEKQARWNKLFESRWPVSIDDIEEYIVSDVAESVKADIAEIDGAGKKKYARNSQPSTQTPPTTPAQPRQPASAAPAPARAAAPAPSGDKPISPSLTGSSDQTNAGTPAGGVQKSFGEEAASVHFK